MNQRILYFDVSRALCVMWIVCFWHMNAYIEMPFKFFENDTMEKETLSHVTDGILALFTFISGFFMSQKEIRCFSDIIVFFKKRMLRFLLPLFISCVILAFGGFISYFHIFTICFGLSQFLPYHYPDTLWYFSMIIFFYLITPLILYLKVKGKFFCGFLCILIYLILLLGYKYCHFDKRLSDYFLFYSIPYIIKPSIINVFFSNKLHYLIMPICICVFFIAKSSNCIIHFFSNFSVCILIVSLSTIIANQIKLKKLFEIIAYASMFAYLYHREVLITSRKLLGDFNYLQSICISLIIFVLSYYGQKTYDSVVKKYI